MHLNFALLILAIALDNQFGNRFFWRKLVSILPRDVVSKEEMKSPAMRQIIQDAFNMAVDQNVFCKKGDPRIVERLYMARVQLGYYGPIQFEFIFRVESKLIPGDCYNTGIYKFTAIDDGGGLRVTVERFLN